MKREIKISENCYFIDGDRATVMFNRYNVASAAVVGEKVILKKDSYIAPLHMRRLLDYCGPVWAYHKTMGQLEKMEGKEKNLIVADNLEEAGVPADYLQGGFC